MTEANAESCLVYFCVQQKTEPAPLHSEALTLLSVLFELKLCSLSEGENYTTNVKTDSHLIKSTVGNMFSC